MRPPTMRSSRTRRIDEIGSLINSQAEVLIARNVEMGNVLARQLSHFVGASVAGVVVGVRMLFVLTRRRNTFNALPALIALTRIAAAGREADLVIQ